MRAVAAGLLAIAALSGSRAGECRAHPQAGLTDRQAREIVLLVVEEDGYDMRKPGMDLSRVTTRGGGAVHPGYLDFSLTFDSPQAGATDALRSYAISRRTADVWEVTFAGATIFPRFASRKPSCATTRASPSPMRRRRARAWAAATISLSEITVRGGEDGLGYAHVRI